MVNIEILRDYICTDTIVPNEFIDFFMPEANGEFVRYIYIYYEACNLMHLIAQFLQLPIALTIQKWMLSALCATGRRPDYFI